MGSPDTQCRPLEVLRQTRLGTGAVGMAPAAQALGSHGFSGVLLADGVAMFPFVELVVGWAEEVDGVVPPAPVVAVDAGAPGGASTLNWVPVTTVTWTPAVTWLGS